MGKLILYGIDPSGPTRSTLLTLKALGIPYEYKIVNLLTQEQLSKEFLAKNPQHTVPTLEDDGHFIWDSHAINAYLVSKYAKEDSLYPKDLLKRALVDQRLHFESSVLFGALRNINYPLLYHNETNVPQHKIDAIVESYTMLETFLKERDYFAGDKLTIADFSIVSAVTSLAGFVDFDANKWPKLNAWVKRIQQLPYYEEANGNGAKQLIAIIKSKKITIVP